MAPFNMPASDDDGRRPKTPDRLRPERSRFARLSLAVASWFVLQLERRAGRLALRELNDGQLKDIGLSRNPSDGSIDERP